jgi:predicted DNA-binding protein
MRISVRLSRELSSRLDRLVALTGSPKLFLIRDILQDGIVGFEDSYLASEPCLEPVRVRPRRKTALTPGPTRNRVRRRDPS